MLEYRSVSYSVQQRELVIRVAPYGEVADYGTGYRERYTRGSVTPAEHVALKLETGPEHQGVIIGRAVGWEERTDGLYGTFRVSEIPAGDDALILATDGALKASAGFIPDIGAMSTRTADGVTTAVGEIREVTLTGTPVYQLAGVAEVRSLSGKDAGMDEATPTPDPAPAAAEVTPDPRIAELETRAAAAEAALEDVRRQLAKEETPPADELPDVKGDARPFQFRSAGHLMVATRAAFQGNDPEARAQIGQLLETRAIVPTAKGVDLSVRAFANPAVPGTDDKTPNAYVPDMLELIRQGRAVANGFQPGNLDDYYGRAVDMPNVIQGATVDYHAPGGSVSSTNVQSDLQTFPKAVLAGGQGYSWESSQWASPSYVQTLISDLLRAYGEKVEFEVINGVQAAGPPQTVNGLLTGGTAVPVPTDDMAGLVAAIGTATANHMKKQAQGGVGEVPRAILINPRTWGWAIGQTDASGRPLLTQEFPQNPVGVGSAVSVGTIRSLPAVVSAEIPEDAGAGTDESPVIVTSFRDAWLLESAGAPAQVSLTFPDSLTTDLTAFGAIATAIRRPETFQVITGFKAT